VPSKGKEKSLQQGEGEKQVAHRGQKSKANSALQKKKEWGFQVMD